MPFAPIVRPSGEREEEAAMQLINTDGMAFIGPGSEWFWTALTGLVLAVTFVGIYRQLSIARSASAREQLASFSREWTSERMLLHRLEVLVELRDGTDPAHLPAGSPDWIGAFWEDMGNLTRRGHLDPKLVWESGPGPRSEAWWKTLAPYVRRVRAEEGSPTFSENFEWYAGINAEFNRGAGLPPVDDALIAHGLEGQITMVQNWLRVERELRTVIVASPDVVPAAPPAPPTAPAAAQV
jgi:hypothetical protein